MTVGEAHYNEESGQDDEPSHLDGLATEGVDCGDRHPVSRDGTGQDDDQVSHGGVVQKLVDTGERLGVCSVADGFENNGVIQRETVESYIKSKP